MKKIALALTLALPFVFASCGNDDDELNDIVLNETSVEILYGQSKTITSSEKNATFVSNNTFVATVNQNGEIEAEHVGEAVITVTKEGCNPAQCKVVVKATNNNFDLPVLQWNITQAELGQLVPSKFKVLSSDSETVFYNEVGDAYPWYSYNFKENRMNAAGLHTDTNMAADEALVAFIEQRYKEIEETETGWIYIDADTKTAANVQVEIKLDPVNDLVTTTWVPMTHVTKAGNEEVKEMTMKLHNRALNLKK